VATRCTRMGTPSTLLGRSRTPIRDLSRISKQFRKGNSPKLVCRMVHSSARWPPYGRPETPRRLKVDHYLSHTGIRMRSSHYAASPQDADTGAGGRQEFGTAGSITDPGHPGIGVCTSLLKARTTSLDPGCRAIPQMIEHLAFAS
jgi:hypothetical protein